MRRRQGNSRGRRTRGLGPSGALANTTSVAEEPSPDDSGDASAPVAGPSHGVATVSASRSTQTTRSLPDMTHPPINFNFKVLPDIPLNLATKLEHFSTQCAPLLIPQFGTAGVLRTLVDKIFTDNFGRYNIFLVEATICPTSSPGSAWLGPTTGPNLTGLRFRHFIRLIDKNYVVHVFDQPPTIPVFEFTLEYMHPKYRRQQVAEEIFARASGRYEVGHNMILLRSTTSEAYYSYPKNYLFYSNAQ